MRKQIAVADIFRPAVSEIGIRGKRAYSNRDYIGPFTQLTTAQTIMRIAKVTKIIVALLILTFVGQSVASVSVSCMDNMPECQEQIMDDTKCVDMNAPDSSGACADCVCSPASCSPALLSVFQPAFEPTSSFIVSHYAHSIENQLAVSLYRPPISR